MYITMLKSKIHRATVTQSELNYVGSITIDKALMDAAGILEYEKVQIADIDNGNRFETYVIAGEKDSGCICLNGAAAKCVEVGDKIIIMAYVQMTPEENAKLTIAILQGEKGHKRNAVLLNAGAALYIGGKAESMKEGIALAADLIDSGKALETLNKLIEVSNRPEVEE